MVTLIVHPPPGIQAGTDGLWEASQRGGEPARAAAKWDGGQREHPHFKSKTDWHTYMYMVREREMWGGGSRSHRQTPCWWNHAFHLLGSVCQVSSYTNSCNLANRSVLFVCTHHMSYDYHTLYTCTKMGTYHMCVHPNKYVWTSLSTYTSMNYEYHTLLKCFV